MDYFADDLYRHKNPASGTGRQTNKFPMGLLVGAVLTLVALVLCLITGTPAWSTIPTAGVCLVLFYAFLIRLRRLRSPSESRLV